MERQQLHAVQAVPPVKRIAFICAALCLSLAVESRGAAIEVQAFFGKESLPFSWVSGVFRDGNDVWVGTKNGTMIYSLAGKAWRTPPQGFAGNVVTGLARVGGSLYVATDAGLNVGGPAGWKAMDRIANAVASDADLAASGNKLWMAARSMTGGLLQLDGTGWKLLSRGEGTALRSSLHPERPMPRLRPEDRGRPAETHGRRPPLQACP